MLRNIEKNPREHAKAVTLRSGKELASPTPMVVETEKVSEEVDFLKEEEIKSDGKEVKKPSLPTYKPPIRYA